ncbi:hypothetical protein GCM10020218_027700 [Dactylosporangium vinaceum]
MGKVVMYSSVSVDGFIADDDDRPGPAVRLGSPAVTSRSTTRGALRVSQASYDYVRPYWDGIG